MMKKRFQELWISSGFLMERNELYELDPALTYNEGEHFPLSLRRPTHV